jgi:DNA primase catalytic subunit
VLKEVLAEPGVAKRICKEKDDILAKMSESPTWWGALRQHDVKRFNLIANAAIRDVACNIDERVTIDTKRLMRYPNTLHGKSGLKASKIAYRDLKRFDPLVDAVAFKGGSIKVYVRDIPRIRIGNDEIGPIKDGVEAEVSKALGIYLMCRGAAEPRA